MSLVNTSSSCSPAPVRPGRADDTAAGGALWRRNDPGRGSSPIVLSVEDSGSAGSGARSSGPCPATAIEPESLPPLSGSGCSLCETQVDHHLLHCLAVERVNGGEAACPPARPAPVPALGVPATVHTVTGCQAPACESRGRATAVACEPEPALSAGVSAPYLAGTHSRDAQI